MSKEEYIPKGAPRKYRPEMCEKIIEVAEQGGHVAAMCRSIGIKSQDTFFRWVKEYEEFGKAYDESKLASKSFYESLLLAGGLGKIKGFNFNAIAMVMNNKFRDDYTRSANGSNTEINIQHITNVEALDTKSLDTKIEELQKKLKLVPEEDEEEDDK